LGELAANPRELVLTLGECGATHTACAEALHFADTAADLQKKALDVGLGVCRRHARSLAARRESGVSPGCEFVKKSGEQHEGTLGRGARPSIAAPT
jgi:hypothetical protein